jgi:hypothetical protein
MSAIKVDTLWTKILAIIINALDSVAPIRQVCVRNYISTSKIRTALRLKRRLFCKFSEKPTTINLINYTKAAEIAKNEIQNDTKRREEEIINSKNQKKFWTYINHRLSNNERIKSINHSGQVYDDEIVISNIFNKFFASIFASSPTKQVYNSGSYTHPKAFPILTSFSITTTDIINVLRSVPPKTSSDREDLSYKVLKEGGIPLANALAQLFTLSIESSEIPPAWKMALVTPIFKGGDRLSVLNYRPISVTSCCCRIFERIIRHKILHFISENDIITSSQHGFQAGLSTDTILLTFYDYVTKSLDDNLIVDTIYFDFSKAFDTIPHDVLLRRLSSHGIQGKVLRWIQNFLTDRQQIVRVGQTYSETQPVTSGIIQGSVLGPLLFNIYINDIDSCLSHSKILKYADDIRIFLSSSKQPAALSDLQAKLQNDIDRLVEWTHNSGMRLNINKCFFASFGANTNQRQYSIQNNVIPNPTNFKDLGVKISTPFSFNSHIDYVIPKAFSRLGLIYKLFHIKSSKNILQLYKTFVRPILEYSSIIWNPHTKCFIEKLERVQKRMCRMIPGLRNLPYDQQLKKLRIHSLTTRRTRYQLIMVYKMYHNIGGLNFNNFFSVVMNKRTRGHNSSLNTKFARTNYRLYYFTVQIIDMWNKLSQEGIDAPNLSQFKLYLDSLFS